MSWKTITASDVLEECLPQEAAAIATVQGKNSLPNILARVVASIRGYIIGGGYPVTTDETKIPEGLFADAIDITRWRMLCVIPKNAQIQTEIRKEQADKADAKLKLIAAQDFSVEKPDDVAAVNTQTGCWNSENKIIMRTHPVPRPATQFSPRKNSYANPDAPQDSAAD